MKKFFLIPLLTLMCSVMAWADPVTTPEELQAALNAGGDITLTADIALGGANVIMSSGTATLDLNGHDLTSTLGGYGADKGALNVSGGHLTINATNGGRLRNTGSESCGIVVANGANLTINGGAIHGGYESIYTDGANIVINDGAFTTGTPYDNCIWTKQNETYPTRIVIKGGTFTGSTGWRCFQIEAGTELRIEGGTFIGQPQIFWAADDKSITITGGAFNEEPTKYVVFEEALMTVADGIYTVSKDIAGGAYLLDTYTVYGTLQGAVDAASAGGHILVLTSGQSATVDKNLTFELGENSATITAASGYQKSVNGDFVSVMAEGSLGAYLNSDSETPFEVNANTDLSAQGLVKVKGNKKISVNTDVIVNAAYKVKYPQIRVPNGASLTIEGDGTIASDKGLIAVEKGGVLTIGKANKSDQPKFTTSENSRVNHILVNNGNVTINNAKMKAKSAAIQNNGVMNIFGGIYTGEASTANSHRYCITTDSGSKLTLKNATVKGVHGAVACQAIAGNESSALIDSCTLIATDSPNGVKANDGGVHYGLYVATLSVVSVYNTKMYSTKQAYSTYIGDNDAYTTFGLIYLYDGCLLKQKMHVQQTKDRDDDLVFPVSISKDSEWYKVASKAGGGFGPLPANCVYKAIIKEGEPTDEQVLDAAAYDEGYRWKVVSTATKTAEVDENATTIPWQQSSTWDASASSESTTKVPTEATVVTIPEGKTVVISADDNENNGVTEAKAEQIFLADGAKLTVETGTTLKVGEGGVNIANGGQLVVEPGAIVTVGATGLVTTEEEALVIEATEEDQGVFLLQPTVTENTQPKATVKLVTKCKQVGANEFVWERFAIPTLDGNATIFNAERLDTVTIYGGGSFQQGLYEWDGSAWTGVGNWHDLKPFKGYQLTNNSVYGNVVYTFEGNLAGNVDQQYQFAERGFGFFGNSYTGDIDILKFFESFDENMQKTIWIYDYYTDQFKAVTETSYGSVYYGKRNDRHGAIKDIRSMQAFLMNTFAAGESTQSVDYSAAIWGNPKYGLVPTPTPAPAKRVAANEDKFTVYVAGAKQEDEVTFIRSNAYSAAFDNGADASKWMNNGLNLYVATEDGELASVASDEIVDMTIAFQSGNETEYTLGFDNLRGETFELRDILTGATIQMTEGATYTFSQEANTTVPARFQIIGARKVATGVENESEGAAVQQKVIENGVLYILRDNKWYNAQGQIVK